MCGLVCMHQVDLETSEGVDFLADWDVWMTRKLAGPEKRPEKRVYDAHTPNWAEQVAAGDALKPQVEFADDAGGGEGGRRSEGGGGAVGEHAASDEADTTHLVDPTPAYTPTPLRPTTLQPHYTPLHFATPHYAPPHATPSQLQERIGQSLTDTGLPPTVADGAGLSTVLWAGVL